MTYGQTLELPEVLSRQHRAHWQTADPGTHVLGESVRLRDGREVYFALVLRLTEGGFAVESEVSVDDPRSDSGARALLGLPETEAGTLAECVDTVHDHARRLAEAGPWILRDLVRPPG
ncbi:hypothetical protein [Streptomyces sp. NPDC096132]|uniref:hypothetical protein n=1 Tax=Streptomyces sp. NPDC096132 TaxID=3366075 RepID=UPI0037F84B1D